MSATPEEDLRAEITAAVDAAFARVSGGSQWKAIGSVAADLIAPLFAARVAAIEAENHNLLHDVRTSTLRARTYAERIDRAEAERDRFREHSVQLNTIGWKLAEAVGDVGPADTEVDGDRLGRLARLVAERDDARAELAACQELVADLVIAGAAERTQAAAQAWSEGVTYAMERAGSVPIWRRDANPYRGGGVVSDRPEVCKIWHDLYGACELPYRHVGPHSRIPGGATEANMWWGTTCECDACRPERAKLAEVQDTHVCPYGCECPEHNPAAGGPDA